MTTHVISVTSLLTGESLLVFLYVDFFIIILNRRVLLFGSSQCFISSQNKPAHFTEVMYVFTVTAVVNTVKELCGVV